ncbi:MAG: hypothetical protein ABI846_03480 [Rudaea sp.]
MNATIAASEPEREIAGLMAGHDKQQAVRLEQEVFKERRLSRATQCKSSDGVLCSLRAGLRRGNGRLNKRG